MAEKRSWLRTRDDGLRGNSDSNSCTIIRVLGVRGPFARSANAHLRHKRRAEDGAPGFLSGPDVGHPSERMGHPMYLESSGNVDWMWAFGGVGIVAAPLPFTGLCGKSSCDRVAVDVAELFYTLSIGKDVEVVVAGFPDVVFRAGAGEALLEDLNGER